MFPFYLNNKKKETKNQPKKTNEKNKTQKNQPKTPEWLEEGKLTHKWLQLWLTCRFTSSTI